MIAGTLEIQLLANMARLQNDMDAAKRSVGGAMSSIEKSVVTARNALVALGSVLVATVFAVKIKEAAMLAARFETMGVVMRVAGNNAGYTMQQMEALSKQLQQSGISMIQSRNSLTQLATANIDLSKASELARAAQNLAVVGNINSSEALGRLIHGIKSGEVEILRTIGLNVSFENSYKKLAAELGVTSDSLTEQQKTLARTNAAIEESARYNGIYEESMSTAGKAIGSLSRYFEDLAVKAGGSLLPAIATFVFNLTDALKAMNAEMDKAGQDGTVLNLANALNKVLKVSLETISILAANVSFVFSALGREIGGIAAQAAAVARLDFSGAAAIGQAMKDDGIAGRATLDAFEQKILGVNETVKKSALLSEAERIAAGEASKAASTAADKQVTDLKNLNDWTKQYGTEAQKAKIATDEWRAKMGSIFTPEMEEKLRQNFIKPNKEAEQAIKAAATQYETLALRLNERIELAAQEIKAGKELTDAQKEEIKINELLDSSKGKLNASQRASIEAALAQVKVNELLVNQQRTNIAAAKDYSDQEAKRVASIETSVVSMAEQNKILSDEVGLLGLSEQAQAAVVDARQSSIISIKEEQLARMQNTEFMGREQIALEEEIRLLKERQGLTYLKGQKNIAIEQAKEARAEWTKFYDSVYQGLTDSLYRGFEAGKGFFQSFWDSIKNLFKTTVLKLSVQGVLSATGLSGLSGAASAASSSGGILGGLSNLSTLNSIGSTIANGFAATVGTSVGALFGTVAGNTATGIALGLGSGSSLAAASAASVAGGGAAAGAGLTSAASMLGAIPGIGWAALAAVAVASIFGGRGKKESTGMGLSGTLSASGSAVQQYSSWKQDGGWFRSDRSGTDYSAISGELQKVLDTTTSGIMASTKTYASAIGLSADAVDGFSQAINISLAGLDAAGQQAAIEKALSGFADGMASVYGGITLLAKEGEGASTTLARLSSSLTVTNAWLSMTRQRLLQVSLAGADAASKLADTFGGLEAMGSAVQTYYGLFFTASERATYATEQMTTALAAFGVTLPETKDGFRALADSLDLNTDSGRKAYAVLLALAPEFATAADQASKLAQDMATSLLQTFSGRQQLIPLLSDTLASFDDLSGGLSDAADSTLDMGTATGWINRLLGQSSSSLVYFGAQVQDLDQPLSDAQLAALSLSNQILALKLNASRTVTDINGLSAALDGVNTETFMLTIQGLLKNVGEMFTSVLGDISSERVALREAALSIANPSVMTMGQIQRGIAGSNVGMPNNSGVVAAQANLSSTDNEVAAAAAALASARAQAVSTSSLDSAASILAAANQRVNSANAAVANFRAYGNGNFNYFMDQAYAGNDLRGYVPNPSGERNAQNTVFESLAANSALQPAQAAYNNQLAQYNAAYGNYTNQVAAAQAVLDAATVQQTAALTGAKSAQLAYVDSLQNYAIDASKATYKLGQLREETVKYYESQKALAGLMSASAAGLRQTVSDYRYSQLTAEQQFRSLEAQYNTAYSMALSTSGETLTGYADQMSSLLGPMIDKMQEAGYDNSGSQTFIAAMLARAEAVASRVDTLTPANYAADSLTMLGQIDSTLSALEAGSMSAETIISAAINNGRDATVDGLRQILNAMTGRGVSYFANGGAFTNGIASGPTAFDMGIMGESGPEAIMPLTNVGGRLGVRALGGGNAEMAIELRAIREELSQLRAETRSGQAANAGNTGKMLKIMDREYIEGKLVRTDADQPLSTVVAA